jgi:hypothetical protein
MRKSGSLSLLGAWMALTLLPTAGFAWSHHWGHRSSGFSHSSRNSFYYHERADRGHHQRPQRWNYGRGFARVWVPGWWDECSIFHDGFHHRHHHWRSGFWTYQNW